MIWKYWSQAELQKELNKIKPGILTRLNDVIDMLNSKEDNLTSIYEKNNLVKALSNFAPIDCFNNSHYRKYCLNHLPEIIIKNLCKKYFLEYNNFSNSIDILNNKIWDNTKNREIFLDEFDLSKRFKIYDLRKIDSYVDVKPINNKINQELFDYQNKIVTQVKEAFEKNKKRVIIQMPTGSGKTKTAIKIVLDEINESLRFPVIFWLAQSEELCEQALKAFIQAWTTQGNRNCRVCRLWGNFSVPQSVSEPLFIVATLQKINNLIKKNQLEVLKSRTEFVVIDEAHTSVAPTYDNAIEYLCRTKNKLLGLSATPIRSNEKENQTLVDLFHGNYVGIELDENKNVIQYLQERGILSLIKTLPIITNIKFVLSKSEKKYLEEKLDFSPQFLERVANSDLRNAEIISRIRNECKNNKKIILFACNVNHSDFLNSILNYLGINSAHVDAKTSKQERYDIIDRYKNNEIQVICNFNILTVGFDVPDANVVLIARPTNSASLYSQMIGRGIRGPSMGGSKDCLLIDVKDNIQGWGGIGNLYTTFSNLWK